MVLVTLSGPQPQPTSRHDAQIGWLTLNESGTMGSVQLDSYLFLLLTLNVRYLIV